MGRKKSVRWLGLVALAASVSVTAWALEGGHRGPGRREPPPEAVQACQGKSEGDSVQVALPDGEELAATCRLIEDKLVAIPKGAGPEGLINRMADELGLSTAQRDQIRVLLKAEEATIAPVLAELAGLREKIESATTGGSFDESAVRELAEAEAGLRVEVTVSRARTHHDVAAVLTSEQRALARKLGPPREPPPGCGPEFGPLPFGL